MDKRPLSISPEHQQGTPDNPRGIMRVWQLVERAWSNPLFLGVLTMIAFAISFSPKASVLATWFCLAAAWLLAVRLIHSQTHRWKMTVPVSALVMVCFAGFGWWIAPPLKSTLAQLTANHEPPPVPTPVVEVRQVFPSPSPTASPTPKPTPPPSQSDMPQDVLKETPFKGGTPQRLDQIMAAVGYKGPTRMSVLYVKNSDTSETDIIVGTRPDLTAKNSWVLEPSSWVPFEGGEDTSRVYVLSAKDGKIDITFKPASSPSSQTATNENSIVDFRVVRDVGRSVAVEAWYIYSGAVGKDDLYITAQAIDANGTGVPVSSTESPIMAINTKAFAENWIEYQPFKEGDAATSTQIALCMIHRTKGAFYCRRFPYQKVWK